MMMKRICAFCAAGLLMLGAAGCNTSPGATGNSTSSGATGGSTSGVTEYAGTIFDTSYVHEINVEIDEQDWADLLNNPTEKTKYAVDVTIDGETIANVSFATKGNTSLTQVAVSDSERYSFKLNFGKFEDGQTYNGLDKLNLNNIHADATYLKDYISYRIMAEGGVDAPLVSFVSLSINGEVHGLYVAIEEVGDAFLERNYGENAGELYKPESTMFEGMGGMGGFEMPADGDFEMPEGFDPFGGNGDFTPPTGETGAFDPPGEGQFEMPGGGGFNMPDMGSMDDMPGMGDMGGFGGFGGSAGADLAYTDDELDSYSDIFDNAETKPDDEDKARVVEALKQLSTGEDLESYIDIEAVLRYFVAHNFVINDDSYTGAMLHNYYLYEQDGKLSILPWDYNLAFGGFSGGDATDAVNRPIDSPLTGGATEESRPLWGQLAASEEYMDLYHQYFDELLSGYFESGRFAEEIDALYELLRPYVAEDPTAFYTVEEFDTAVETLKQFCLLRAESVRGQLDGDIPATSAGRQEDSALVDAGEMDLEDMGSMLGGEFGVGGQDWAGGR